MEIREYNAAWTDFALAFQELCDAIRMLHKEQAHVRYWVCTQNPDHFFDIDDWRIINGGNHWRTHGKQLCPQCAGILEERAAKVGKR